MNATDQLRAARANWKAEVKDLKKKVLTLKATLAEVKNLNRYNVHCNEDFYSKNGTYVRCEELDDALSREQLTE